MGLMLRNLPSPFNVSSYISSRTSTVLRKAALTVILTRAGLEIDPEVILFFSNFLQYIMPGFFVLFGGGVK